jgi:hypothetical protein
MNRVTVLVKTKLGATEPKALNNLSTFFKEKKHNFLFHATKVQRQTVIAKKHLTMTLISDKMNSTSRIF